MEHKTAILIPSYNPDKRIISLLNSLRSKCSNPFIVVNDGSKEECKEVFKRLEKIKDCIVIEHCVNLGKGRALKSGFNYYLLNYDGCGVITADGDGQHACDDIVKCTNLLEENKNNLVLGTRDFSSTEIPWKSSLGNKLTKMLLGLCLRYPIKDTQTGLRGIPTEFMKYLMNSYGERFEFETVMLFEAKNNGYTFLQNNIKTIYSDNNKGTHFDPIRDSIKIYSIIIKYTLKQFVLFGLSSIASAIVDLTMFALLFHVVLCGLNTGRLFFSVFMARICSMCINYLLNKNCVFQRNEQRFDVRRFLVYCMLCAVIMFLSYSFTKIISSLLQETEITIIKTMTDLALFLISYSVQKRYIFRRLEQ